MSPLAQNVQIVAVRNVRSYRPGAEEHSKSGALDHPFLEQGVAQNLELAAETAIKDFGVELVILDALRVAPSSDDISAAWHTAEAEILSHRTGGAVDVALMKEGDFLPMGSAYGSADAAPDAPAEAIRNQEILRSIMEQTGFIGTQGHNWWHYERGTQAWADRTGKAAYLTAEREPPRIDHAEIPTVDSLVAHGCLIAPAFLTSTRRAAVLAHREPGHFYARHSNEPTERLANYLKDLLNVQNVGLVESGLAASISTLRATVPKGGTLVCDNKIYYEVHRSIIQIANDFNWNVVMCDMSNPANLGRALTENGGASVVYADNPSNWFLEVLDVKALSELAHNHGAKLVLDTTLQPLQNARAKGADVEVISLSKYPANGMVMGGACISDDADVMHAFNMRVTCEGHTLGQPAAQIIYEQAQSLQERLRDVSEKSVKIATFLMKHRDIMGVNCPSPDLLDGLSGGQITFLLKDAAQGSRMEAVISNNALSGLPLYLAGTFGAPITTIEHFASNQRHREGIPREATNEVAIPATMVRLGVGAENVDKIIGALDFVLNMSAEPQPIPGIARRTKLDSHPIAALQSATLA